MTLRRICLLVVVVLTWGRPAVAERLSHYALAQGAIDTYVLPHLDAFKSTSGGLAKGIESFCAAPSDDGRKALRGVFREALVAWAQIDIVRFGPISEDGRAQKIAFWPDPRGAVERQVRTALAQRDAALVDGAALRAQSAALQGFPALESLIADTTSPIGAAGDEGAFRCRAARTIAANIARHAEEMQTGWTVAGGWRERMLRPGSDNPAYASASDAATDVVKSLTTSLQLIIEAQMKPLAEAEKGKGGKAPALPYRRLGLSRDYLLAGISGCRELYAATRLESYLDVADKEQAGLAKLVNSGFAAVERDVASERWLGQAQGSGGASNVARAAYSTLSGARRAIATRIAEAAEISLGFNELDGD